ncbi:DTW domain-containing protein [Rhodoferax koreense]|uniref:tRNA-uridine aminocarboxypropyltransferase n=1 Tax=Rhodoferax koreensis TaxID=1842727 RepID=A0A1P8JZU0_9BURK|nr:tRNA-uridine aminocarboxypropyltransferase [Rhodoferax koreense]APW39270.1 DTW domain-containing protein [Rhodoferax koreense]
MPNNPPVSRRASCAACNRPASACICGWVVPVAHRVEVLILQHPLEVAHAKNSARLLHLCLPHSRLVVGEAFDDKTWLTAPWNAGDAPRRPVLLYPATPLDQAVDLVPPPALDAASLAEPARLRLVVLDGTWRKSRKMLYASPALQQLPRLALRDIPPSRYLIRKARRPDQLSTLEAVCAALKQIEGDAVAVGPLLAAFDGFVGQQLSHRTLGR